MKYNLEEIFNEHIKQANSRNCSAEPYVRLERNEKILRAHLNKKDKKLLLRIIDDKDLIKEDISSNSFIAGFKLGVNIGYESNKD